MISLYSLSKKQFHINIPKKDEWIMARHDLQKLDMREIMIKKL